MIVTADTSVVIPALAEWHEFHKVARSACRGVEAVPAHVLLESVSVLTRLPGGVALTTPVAVSAVRGKFPAAPLTLTAAEYDALAVVLADRGLRGGQVYDALVAATAASRGAKLLTLDRRAASTYRAVGVDVELLASAG